MTAPTMSSPRPSAQPRGRWLIPVGLLFLTFIPILAGAFRLTELGGGPEIVPAQERFTGSPIPVVLHVVGATLFSVLGAFQFLPGLRRGKRSWHKIAGRVLIPAGMVAALSGLWMAAFYAHPAGDGPLLLVFRLVFGSYMVISIVLAVRAIFRREFASHGAWMTRAYALGVAAGTQALVLIPVEILFPPHHELARALAIGLAWMINLAVAEFAIRRRRAVQLAAAPRKSNPVLSEVRSA